MMGCEEQGGDLGGGDPLDPVGQFLEEELLLLGRRRGPVDLGQGLGSLVDRGDLGAADRAEHLLDEFFVRGGERNVGGGGCDPLVDGFRCAHGSPFTLSLYALGLAPRT